MPDLVTSPAAPLPQAAGAGTTLPGQPPIGSSPLMPPVPNRGLQVQAMALVEKATRMLEQALPGLGVETEVGQAVYKAIGSLAKHVPEGTTSSGIQDNAMHQFMSRDRQMAPLMGVLAALGQGQGQAQPGAAPPRPLPM